MRWEGFQGEISPGKPVTLNDPKAKMAKKLHGDRNRTVGEIYCFLGSSWVPLYSFLALGRDEARYLW